MLRFFCTGRPKDAGAFCSMGEARGCFAFFCTGKPENASRRGRIQGSIPIWQVGSLNGAETLAIALLEVMLCPKRDAP